MSTQLERQLAEALASAVNAESIHFHAAKKAGLMQELPSWYQEAVEALAEYEEQNRPRVNY
jgi:hypothetical protein